jgi:hypothetical protein
MRSALVQLAETRTAGDHRKVLWAAIRQLERADLYLAAVEAMGVDDLQSRRALNRLRSDLDSLRRHLVDVRALT